MIPSRRLLHTRSRRILGLLLLVLLLYVPTGLSALPLAFVRNAGQWDARADYLLANGGMRLWFTDRDIYYDLDGEEGRGHRLRLRFDGVGGGDLCGVNPLTAQWNFIERGEAASFNTITAEGYGGLHYDAILPGVDRCYYSDNGRVKYDLVIAPGADPSAIRFHYDGADKVSIHEGSLVVATSVGDLREAPPVAWQDVEGVRHYVGCRFTLDDGGDGAHRGIGFALDEYDHTRPLVIDPLILFSSYLGGSGIDQGVGVDRDTSGNLYVVGTTRSNDFPTTLGAYRRTQISVNGTSDIFVARLNATGTTLLSATYIGGTGADEAAAIRLADNGRVYVAGTTSSTDFPGTTGRFAPSSSGGSDGFILALSPDGSALLFATYFGGANDDHITDLAIGNNNSPYVSGWSSSGNLPIPVGSFVSPVRGGEDGFVARFSAGLDTLRYTAILGGSLDERAAGVVVEPGGAAWVTGWTRSNNFPTTDSAFAAGIAGGRDCFITRVRFNGAALDYSTMIGGTSDDEGNAIAVDSSGNAYAAGRTLSPDYPVRPLALPSTPGSWFVTKVAWPPTPRLLYSRYLGVADNGSARTIQVDRGDDAYIGGVTNSTLFPRTADADTSSRRGGMDLALVRLDPTGGTIRHATVIGGSRGDTLGHGSHLLAQGILLLTGTTASSDFPLKRGAFDSTLNQNGLGPATDAFVLQYAFERRAVLFAAPRRTLPQLGCDSTELDSFYVYNVGEGDLIISDNIFKLGSSPYTLVQPRLVDLPKKISPGDSLLYVVRVTTRSTGTVRDTLLVTSNDSLSGKRQFAIAFSTLRTISSIAAIPRSISFGNVVVCPSVSTDTLVRINNNGDGAVTVIGASFLHSEGSFSFGVSPSTPTTLLMREEMPIIVRFRPLGRGLHRDTLVVRIRECAVPLLVPLEGNGDSVALRFVGSELRLPPLPWCAAAFDTVVTLSNDGDRAVTLTEGRVLGSGFVLLDTLPITVASGGKVSLRLRVIPPPLGAIAVAVLQISAAPCGLSLAIGLGVERRAKDSLVVPDSTLNFGSIVGCRGVDVGIDTVIVLRNIGRDTVTVTGALIPTPFTFSTLPSFPVTVPPGDSLMLPLRYVTSRTSQDQGDLLIVYRSQGCLDTLRIALRGSREDVRVAPSQETITLPDVLQCKSNADTTVVLTNLSGVPVTIDSVATQRGAFVLRRLPFTLQANSSDTVTLRLVPSQAGADSGSVTFYTNPCREPLRFDLRGRKEGVVLAFDPPDLLRFPTILSCALSDTVEMTAIIRNSGNHPSPAEILSYNITGDPSFVLDPAVVGLVIPSGEERTIRIKFIASSVGAHSGQLELVTAPCGDTLRLNLDARVESPQLEVTGGSFGGVALGGKLVGSVTVVNRNTTALRIDSIGNLVPPFRLILSRPLLPVLLQPGDSLVLDIEFAPKSVSLFTITPSVAIGSPCIASVPFTLDGTGEATNGDTVLLCLDGITSGLVGDTLRLTVQLLSPSVPLSPPRDILYGFTYTWERLQFLDGIVDGAPLQLEPGSPRGRLLLRRVGANDIGPGSLELRFRLLVGRPNPAFVRLDSVLIGTGLPVVQLCTDSVRVNLLDRCIVTGLAFGRTRNMLSPPKPNPARGAVEITWGQLEDAHTRLMLVDITGREVLNLLDADLPGGEYSARFSTDELASGVYFYIIEAGSFRSAKQMVIIN